MKKCTYILFILFLWSLQTFGQRAISEPNNVSSSKITEIKALQDSIYKLESALNSQALEIQKTNQKITLEKKRIIKKIDQLNCELGVSDDSSLTTSNLDRFWIILCGALVFFMQAGFKVLEMGMVRSAHSTGIGLKNLIDLVATTIIYFLVGFSIMFGFSQNGFIGSGLCMPTAGELEALFITGQTNFGMEFFLFQMAFAATAATIVSGAMSERTALLPYLLIALFVAGFIYPVAGHMVWGNNYLWNGSAWLSDTGFIDFAGSTVVHSVGAWVAVVGICIIGPRNGRFRPDGTLDTKKFKPANLGYSVLGVFILWFGWWGFNGGSGFKFDYDIATIITNTNLAGASAALIAMLHAFYFDKENLTGKIIGGALSGLVAITASANVVDSVSALAIGSIAGIIHNLGYDLLIKLKLDDPVGAIPVHGFTGLWGTIAVGIFGKEQLIRDYRGLTDSMPWDRTDQILTQFTGAWVIILFVGISSFLFLKLIDTTIGLRVDPETEKRGYTFTSK